MPDGVVRVAESGIRGPADAGRAAAAGYHAVLVGESLVTSARSGRGRGALCGRDSATRRGRPRRSIPAVFVKICGITSEEDALLAVAMGADAVGFVFAPSLAPGRGTVARDIVRRLPPEILTVGVFRDEAPQRVVEIVHTRRPAGRAAARPRDAGADASGSRERVPFVIKALRRRRPGARPTPTTSAPTRSSIDSPRPGSGQVFDWSLAEGAPIGRG